MSDTTPDPSRARPLLWFVAPFLGETSEIWILRQIMGLNDFDIEVLCWRDIRSPDQYFDAPVHIMADPLPSRRGEDGFAKWTGRLTRAAGRNYLAAHGEETNRIAALAARRKPDVMLCHYGQTALRMRPVATRLGVPQVAHFHGEDLSSSFQKNRWYRWSLISAFSQFDRIVTVGLQQQEFVTNNGVDPTRVACIPCGAPIDEFSRQQLIPDGPPNFITVSRLTAQKGIDINIRAFARIAKEFPGARLTVVGDGPDRDKLSALALDVGVADQIDFTGFLSPMEVRHELEKATIFLQHSLGHEGFGVSLTEAMAMEMPVIVSNCGGLLDQVTHNETGLICPQGNVAVVTDAMRSLVANTDLSRRLGRAARNSALENFDTERQIAKLSALLLSVATRS